MPRSFDTDNYTLGAAELDRIFHREVAPYLFGNGPVPSESPVLILVGAQPGAGKTQAGASAVAESNQTITPVVGDKLRRFHPDYTALLDLHPSAMPDATAQASSALVERALAFAAHNRFSVLVEGTFRDADVPLSTAQQFRCAGFRVETHLVAVAPEISHVGIGKRFVDDERASGAARFTSLAAHDRAFNALGSTILALSARDSPVQRFVVRSRDRVIFDRQRSTGHSIRGALHIAKQQWNRALSDAEFQVWRAQAAAVAVYLRKQHPGDTDAGMLVRQLDFDQAYLMMVRSGEVAVRGHVRAGGDVEPYIRSRPTP